MKTKPDFKRAAVRRIRKPARQYIPDAVALANGIHCMDALELAWRMPSESVQCIVTSPPYFGLRSYLPGKIKLREDLPPDVRQKVLKELEALGIFPIHRI